MQERSQFIRMKPHWHGLIETQLRGYILTQPLLPYYYLTVQSIVCIPELEIV